MRLYLAQTSQTIIEALGPVAKEAKSKSKKFFAADSEEFFNEIQKLGLRKANDCLDDFIDAFRVSYKNKFIHLTKLQRIIEISKYNEYLQSFSTKKRKLKEVIEQPE